MAGSEARRRKRSRGSIEELPSGSLRVSVYAGIDPVTKNRHYLREIVPAGPKAVAEADKVIRRLASQVDERRHPRTTATVDQDLTGNRQRRRPGLGIGVGVGVVALATAASDRASEPSLRVLRR